MNNSQTQEHIFWETPESSDENPQGKSLIVSYQTTIGWTIDPRSACVNPYEFNLAKGRELCFRDAVRQLSPYHSYLYQYLKYKKFT